MQRQLIHKRGYVHLSGGELQLGETVHNKMGGLLGERTSILTLQTQCVENQAVVPVRADVKYNEAI
jgi:hypothetical protein